MMVGEHFKRFICDCLAAPGVLESSIQGLANAMLVMFEDTVHHHGKSEKGKMKTERTYCFARETLIYDLSVLTDVEIRDR